jgi:hypothetical protein
MPSKFPGMDPYLEGSLWPDFHARFIVALAAAVTRQAPVRFVALVDQHVWLEVDERERSLIGKPDIFVPELSPGNPGNGTSVAVLEAPVHTRLVAVRKRPGTRRIQVIDRENRKVVTVLELLSPANKKPGRDRTAYLEKREEYEQSGINFLELDLLRDFPRMPLGEPEPAIQDYLILLLRAEAYPQADLWPFSVRRAFPPLVVPLIPNENDIVIDLNACFRECYDSAQYGRLIDYSQPAEPPLNEADAAWAATLPPHG